SGGFRILCTTVGSVASIRPVVIRPVGDCVWPTEQLWSMVRTDHDEPDEDSADYESEGRLPAASARILEPPRRGCGCPAFYFVAAEATSVDACSTHASAAPSHRTREPATVRVLSVNSRRLLPTATKGAPATSRNSRKLPSRLGRCHWLRLV